MGPADFPVVAFRRFQEQQRVACRRRVDDDDLVVGRFDDVGKGMEDGNFLGARRAQVFFDVGQVRRAQAVGFGLAQDFILVFLQLFPLVDMAQGQVVRLADDVLQVSGRVGRRQVDAMAAAGQAQRRSSCRRRPCPW